MSITAIILQTFAIYFLVMGIGVITNWNILHKLVHEFQKERGLMFIMGALVTLLGSFLITIHTTFENIPQITASLLAWGLFAKGVTVVLFPDVLKQQTKYLFKHKGWYYAAAVIIPALAFFCGFLSILA
jgi:hypothetical protein